MLARVGGGTGGTFEHRWSAPAAGRAGPSTGAPPTANGMRAFHHVEARVFKDMFPRFKPMQGFHGRVKGGGGAVGLPRGAPVEVAVENELGLSGTKDIETLRGGPFNSAAGIGVLLRQWTVLGGVPSGWATGSTCQTPYRTMDAPSRVGWWRAEDDKRGRGCGRELPGSAAYCPARGAARRCRITRWARRRWYRDVTETAVMSGSRSPRFPAAAAKGPPGTSRGRNRLVWTTTPGPWCPTPRSPFHPR